MTNTITNQYEHPILILEWLIPNIKPRTSLFMFGKLSLPNEIYNIFWHF